MTDHAALLRQIRADARPYVEQALDLAEVFTGFRKLASENGLDWGVIKALIKAEIQDEKEGGSLKVDRIIEKADFASAYADMLGLGSNMNENNFSSGAEGVSTPSSTLPPHDADGVLIEDETAPVSGDAGEVYDDASPTVFPIVSPPQTIAAVVASTSRDAPAASPFPEIPKFLERRIA